MFHILFTAATAWELKIIKQELRKIKLQNIKINFLLLGIWNYSTIVNLQEVLIKQKYDFIVNIWVCWYLDFKQDSIQISRIKNIANNKELILPILLQHSKLESIACSEKAIFDSDKIWYENYVDMESYWVEFVCSKFQIPRLILKVPVDKIWDETKNFDFKKAKKLLSENIDYKKLSEEITSYLQRNINKRTENDLEVYFNYYKMTFAEKLIFEKLFNKYSVLIEDQGWQEFKYFFDENKELNKKSFFVKLEVIN